MTDDLVTRLRVVTGFVRFETGDRVAAAACLSEEAADRIEADAATIARLEARVKQLEQLDSEAATYVESVIALRTHFTGEPPYVGWKGLGLALNEALDAKEAAEAKVAALVEACEALREGYGASYIDADTWEAVTALADAAIAAAKGANIDSEDRKGGE